MRKPQTILVRNNGTEPFADRYDGEDFDIPPGGETEMLIECATLCLGFGEEDKSRCLRRLGWAFSHQAMAEALKRLDAFSFHMPGEARNPLAATTSASAPGSVETVGEAKVAPTEVATLNAAQLSKSPLAKLAQAQARAG